MSANRSTTKGGSVVGDSQGPRFHPACFCLAQGLVAAVTIHRTKKQSHLRIPAVAIILWLAYLEFTSAVDFGTKGFGNSTFAGYSWLFTAHLINLLWINKVSLGDFNTTAVSIKGQLSRDSFLSVAHLVAFNFRGIGTRWRAKNIPPFSSYYPNRTPQSRAQFLTRQMAVFAFQYLLIDFTAAQASKATMEARFRVMGPGMEFAYFSSTREQWIFRIWFTVAGRWIVNRCFLSALYNLSSLIAVGSGIYSPEDYPPFMGSMWSSYTLRGYWG